MAGGLMLRPQFGDLFANRLAYLDEIIFLNFPHHQMHFDQVFKVRDSNRSYEEITGLSGLGLFSEKQEGEAITYDQIYQLYDKRFTHVTYASGVQVSLETLHYDQDGPLQRGAEALSRAAQVSAEITVWAVLNNSFTTETSPDGSAIFANSHSLAGGGTFDNLISGDLTIGTLEDSFNTFADMTDERGLLIAVQPKILVIPPEQRFYAAMWLQSELLPDTDGSGGLTGTSFNPINGGSGSSNFDLNKVNAINPFRNMGLSYFVSPYLTDADNWFLMGDKEDNPLRVYWGIRPTTDHTIDFDTGNAKTKLLYALSAGAVEWRPMVGGQGA